MRLGRSVCAVFCLIAGCLTVSSSHATLIEQDLNIIGDNLITLDTDTGLEWLDLDQSLGFGYDEIELLFGPTQQFDGYRHATLPEVTTLFINTGFPAGRYPRHWRCL